jgi:hypothetical protein
MVSFIDQHRAEYGVEPICAQLPIAPATYYEQKAREADPEREPPRVRRDVEISGSVAKIGWGRKKPGADFSLGGNLEEALHKSHLPLNV